MSVVQKAPDTMTIIAAAAYVAAPSAVTTSIDPGRNNHRCEGRHQHTLAVDDVRHGSGQESEQHIRDHAQHGQQSDERRRLSELIGEDGDRDELEPPRNARQAADRP